MATIRLSKEQQSKIEKKRGDQTAHAFCVQAIKEKCDGTLLISDVDAALNAFLYKNEESRELIGVLKAKLGIKS